MYLRRELGRQAEQLALRWFLVNRKSTLLTRNYRYRGGEIDLIFEEYSNSDPKSGFMSLVFVEVRARSCTTWVGGPESLSLAKINRLKNTARHFLSRYRGRAKMLRFDLLWWDGKIWQRMENIIFV